MSIVFVNELNFSRTIVSLGKMNDGRTTWIVQRNENDYIEQTISLKDRLERNERNRWKMSDDFKNERILFIKRSKEKVGEGLIVHDEQTK